MLSAAFSLKGDWSNCLVIVVSRWGQGQVKAKGRICKEFCEQAGVNFAWLDLACFPLGFMAGAPASPGTEKAQCVCGCHLMETTPAELSVSLQWSWVWTVPASPGLLFQSVPSCVCCTLLGGFPLCLGASTLSPRGGAFRTKFLLLFGGFPLVKFLFPHCHLPQVPVHPVRLLGTMRKDSSWG